METDQNQSQSQSQSQSQLKPGDPIPGDATGTPNPAAINTQLKPGDPIPQDATSINQETNEPSTLQKMAEKANYVVGGGMGEDLGKGLLEGAGQTVSTVGHLGNTLLKNVPTGVTLSTDPITNKINSGLKLLDQVSTPENAAQKAGVVLEGVGEFVLGDEALKGVSFAERLGLAQKITDIGLKHPIIAKILGHGVQAIRQGIVAGGQSTLHGATPGEAATTGAIATGLGAGTGLIAEGLNTGVGAYKKLLSSAAKTTQELQPDYQQGIKDLVDQVAKQEGVPTAKSASIKDYVGDTAQNVEDAAVKKLQEIDKAAGEPFVQKFRERVANINRQINSLAEAPGGPQEAKLELERTNAIDAMEDAFNEAERPKIDPTGKVIHPGVPRKQLDEGLQQFKKAQALFDLDRELKRPGVVTGMRANEATAKQLAENPEFVNPDKLNTRVNQIYDNGRLQEALGDNRSGNMLRHLNDSLQEHRQLETEAKIAQGKIKTVKKIGVGAAAAVGAGALAKTGSHIADLVKGTE